jgi:hypothetical protein
LIFEEDLIRVYPQKSIASHYVGFVDLDRKGLSGIEMQYDRKLMTSQNLYLAMDVRIQDILFDELIKAKEEFRAKAASGIVINVNNGEILAMASIPSFDANLQSEALPEQRFNMVTGGSYELGSVMKIFTNAAAFEHNLINMEGGLLEDKSSSSNLFEHSKTNVKSSLFDWVKKTKESELVFNTPAFWDCHGWKLGEYLALGKAIITTPLSNDLPKPLIHGTHVHVIPDSSTESIREAVVYILENSSYRKHLESNARKYWEDYGTPEMALQLLFKRE